MSWPLRLHQTEIRHADCEERVEPTRDTSPHDQLPRPKRIVNKDAVPKVLCRLPGRPICDDAGIRG